MGNSKNLRPIKKGQLSHEEAKARGSKGGKVSVIKRRQKKLMSQIYAEFLAKEHNLRVAYGVDKDGDIEYKNKKITGELLVSDVVSQILTDQRSTSQGARVSILKELREATEGSKIIPMGPDGEPISEIKISFSEPSK